MTGCSSAVSLRLPSFLLRPLSPSSSYPLFGRLSLLLSVCLCLCPASLPLSTLRSLHLPLGWSLSGAFSFLCRPPSPLLFLSLLPLFLCPDGLPLCEVPPLLHPQLQPYPLCGPPPLPHPAGDLSPGPPHGDRETPGFSSRHWEASPMVGEWAVGFNL